MCYRPQVTNEYILLGRKHISLILNGTEYYKLTAPKIYPIYESIKKTIIVWSLVYPKQQICLESWANFRFKTITIIYKVIVLSMVLEQISHIMIFAFVWVVPQHKIFLSSSKAIADISGNTVKIFFESGIKNYWLRQY